MLMVSLCSNDFLGDSDSVFTMPLEVDGFSELKVMQTHLCIDISGYDGEGHYQTYSWCQGLKDQRFKYESTGRIINLQNGWCLNGSTSGKQQSAPCAYNDQDQVWVRGESRTFEIGGVTQVAHQYRYKPN